MPLNAGTRFGPYEVQTPLGAGGMGEVYMARDTRLDRTVALKIMPDALAADPMFRDRFEREARTISQLDHPNICALYDVGQEQGRSYLVMQYLEGETLAARLAVGALPLTDVLKIGSEIASALARAHRAGIVHRDLKPGNVMLTRTGAKLLDFGLAKSQLPAERVSVMPTTPAAITAPGTILGTFQYMAPEQLEGQESDARTDIFAFGAVLYEMATGRPAFQGKTQASLAGSILRDDPTASPQASAVLPPVLARVIRTCLAKDPDERFQTVQDLALQLRWMLEGETRAESQPSATLPGSVVAPGMASASGSGVQTLPPAASARRTGLVAWGVAAVLLVTSAGLGWMVFNRPQPVPPKVVRFEVNNPDGAISIGAPRVSPDGRYLAFNATDSVGTTKIWVRQLNAIAAQPLAGTEGASRPFWSPDSKYLGFMGQGKLMKIDIAGGPAQKICDAPSGSDGSWSSEGVILYDGRGSDPIYRVPASGGTPVIAVQRDPARKDSLVGWPEFLPDGRHFMFLAQNEKPDESTYRIGELDSDQSRPFSSGQTMLSYAPPGYLLFVRDQTLVAQPFDASAMKTTGDVVPLAEHIGTDGVGLATFSVSRDGTLAYRVGETGSRLVMVDHSGRDLGEMGEAGEYSDPAVSPDGRRLAFNLGDRRTAKFDLWIRDLERGVSSRLTFGQGDSTSAIWSPDGSTIVFRSTRDGAGNLYQKPSNGQGEEKLLLKTDLNKVPTGWSKDGRYILYQELDSTTNWNVWALPTFGDRQPVAVVNGRFNESNPAFSPDGRFIVYRSNESGRSEIYVQSFPDPSGKWQVSNNGGNDPLWSADGKTIIYRGLDQRIMSVSIKTGETAQVGVPESLFAARISASGVARNRYAMFPDGQRFLLTSPPGKDALTPTTVVLNWSAELHR